MNRGSRSRQVWVAWTAVVLAAVAGCITIEWNGNGEEKTTVTIRVKNTTFVLGVAPQVYATPDAVVDPNADLFVGANRLFQTINFGSGILPHGYTESVELDCADARVIGTLGGRFYKQDGTVVGDGQTVILTQGLQFNCGDTLTFTYKGHSAETIDTDYRVD